MNRPLTTPCLMLTELFLPTKGGTAVSFDDDFRRLGGKEIHVITADVPGAADFDRVHPNTIHRIALRRVPWLKPESLLMYAKLFMKATALAVTRRFIAIFAGRVLPEGLIAWVIARLLSRPVLVYAHGEELTNWGRGRKFALMCFVFRRADAVLANSDFTRETLVGLLGVDPGRIAVVYPTVDADRFRPGISGDVLREGLGLRPGQRLILSVGRLQRRKGFDSVIRALPRLDQQGIDAHYALIGIGEDWEYLQRLAAELGVSDRVHLLGHVSYEDLPHWYAACDLFAMPNRDIDGDTEGFGLVFLEAASAGKPALCGTAGGTGSAVVDGVTGLRVDGEQPLEIARALVRLLTNTTEAERMGLNGRRRVLDNFTHQRRVDQLRALVLRGRYPGADRRKQGAGQSTMSRSVARIAVNPISILARSYFSYFPADKGKWRLWEQFRRTKHYDAFPRGAYRTRYGFSMNLAPDQQIDRFIYFWGCWEPNETWVIRKLLRRNDVFVDVGANDGYFSLLASTLVGPSGQVLALEPIPTTVAELRANIGLNGLANITVIESAASDDAGELSLTMPTRAGTGMTTLRPIDGISCRVTCNRLDRILAHGPTPRLVKIDVEGAELKALRGLEGVFLARDPPDVLCEVTASYLEQVGASAREVYSLMEGFGYRAYLVRGYGLWELPRGTEQENDQENVLFTRSGHPL